MSKIITYYYFDDMIDIRKFESNFLKINKKSHKDFDIYYIGYLTIKKFNNCNGDCDYKKLFYQKYHAKIGANTDYDVPLDKQQKFLSLIIIIRCIFQNGKNLYPQIYLNECLYEL